jgi:hypothetical protein
MALQKFPITMFDVFFLSYDEPNAEKNWADLLDKCPWAKRVHGVKGFDAAHRACAEQSETDWFVTVDADNIVLPAFFDQEVELDPELHKNRCFSWNALNMMNGLMYGNGGLKLWSKSFAINMKSHELSEDKDAVDFCWEEDYKQVHKTFSEVHNNGSPYQAFRVGFREGIKLALDRGQRVPPEKMKSTLHNVNLRNLRIWSSVGGDVEHGLWAIYGTRLGWLKACDMDYDITGIRDYDWFNAYWANEIAPQFYVDRATGKTRTENEALFFLEQEIKNLGAFLKQTTKIAVPYLDADASEFFRDTFKFRND